MATIADIGGLGPKNATKLRKAGVRTTEGLLRVASTSRERKALSEATGISTGHILEWVKRADLMRVVGVGSEYADLLETAGCDTVMELRRRNAANLSLAMIEINEAKRLVRRLPTEAMVQAWIDQAKDMEPAVKR